MPKYSVYLLITLTLIGVHYGSSSNSSDNLFSVVDAQVKPDHILANNNFNHNSNKYDSSNFLGANEKQNERKIPGNSIEMPDSSNTDKLSKIPEMSKKNSISIGSSVSTVVPTMDTIKMTGVKTVEPLNMSDFMFDLNEDDMAFLDGDDSVFFENDDIDWSEDFNEMFKTTLPPVEEATMINGVSVFRPVVSSLETPSPYTRRQLKEKNNTQKTKTEIVDYASTIRKNGLEGTIGLNSNYNSPAKLETKLLTLIEEVGEKVQNYKAIASLEEYVAAIIFDLQSSIDTAAWVKDSPWVKYIRQVIKTACTTMSIDVAGDASVPGSFPSCLIDYLRTVPTSKKVEYGQELRKALGSSAEVQRLFNRNDGLCTITANSVGLRTGFCDDIFDVFSVIPDFVKAATAVQVLEKKHYGNEAAMLSVNESAISDRYDAELSKARRKKGASRSHKILRLQRTIVLKKLWKIFGQDVFEKEADNLLSKWYSDPVHKWRYSIGLFQWLTVTGIWLHNQASLITG